MKIVKIARNHKHCNTYDIEVPNHHNYIIENNLVVHNSSVISNSTNGMEPIRAIVTHKKSKMGVLKQIVPNVKKYKNWYTKAFQMEGGNTGYFNIVAVIQKWAEMSTSTNRYYNYKDYPDGKIPLSVLTKDMLYLYKMGVKSIYYTNTPDDDVETESCASGACAI